MSNYYIMHSVNKDDNYKLVEVIQGEDIRDVKKLVDKKYSSHTQVWKERKYKYLFDIDGDVDIKKELEEAK